MIGPAITSSEARGQKAVICPPIALSKARGLQAVFGPPTSLSDVFHQEIMLEIRHSEGGGVQYSSGGQHFEWSNSFEPWLEELRQPNSKPSYILPRKLHFLQI